MPFLDPLLLLQPASCSIWHPAGRPFSIGALCGEVADWAWLDDMLVPVVISPPSNHQSTH